MVVANLNLDDIQYTIKKEADNYRTQGWHHHMSKVAYMNHVSDKIFGTIFSNAITNLVQKLLRVFKDIDNLIKEIKMNLREQTESAGNT